MAGKGTKRALFILAPGAEEMETVAPVDVLRRAGVRVTVAGLEGPGVVTCSRGVRIEPDLGLEEALARGGEFDLVALPGGAQGAAALAASPRVRALLQEQDRAGRLVAAICAGPKALQAAGVIRGRAFTCHPAAREELAGAGRWEDRPVVRDGNLVTSQGPGTACAWGLHLVEALQGREMAGKVAGPMLVAGW